MFLKQVLRRNPQLIEAAMHLHQSGQILPDTYIIDYDQTIRNAQMILDKANERNIELYFMLKQVGRNPLLAQALVDLGYKGAVVVDYKEALVMMKAGIPLGNVGHLVQTPKTLLRDIIDYGTEVMTVFTMEKLKEINEVGKQLDTVQDVIIKVYSKGDLQYPSQDGGVALHDLGAFIQEARKLKHVAIVGATAFPAFLYQDDAVKPTHNYETIMNAIHMMREMGCVIKQINAPSTTSVRTLQLMSGITHGEPGHGLTGTTPIHAYEDLEEIPAVVYVSEVSHNFNQKGYCYGGGHYRRSHLKHALCEGRILDVDPMNPEIIDYTFTLSEEVPVSSSVIMAFRFQMFVTRSDVAIVKGIGTSDIEILGIYDGLGKKADR